MRQRLRGAGQASAQRSSSARRLPGGLRLHVSVSQFCVWAREKGKTLGRTKALHCVLTEKVLSEQ